MNKLFILIMVLVAIAVFVQDVVGALLPPDPADPATWGAEQPLELHSAEPTPAAQGVARAKARARLAGEAQAQAAPRAAARALSTQRMQRVQGEMLAAIEDTADGGKIAKVVLPDGSVEVRPLRVLYTARVKEEASPEKGLPIDAGHAAAAAAGAVAAAAAAAAAAALKKKH